MAIIKRKNDRDELDILALLKYMLKRLWIIVFVGVLFAGGIVYALYTLKDPEYTASVRLYVNNMVSTKDQENITYQDLTASIALTETYLTIIDSDTVYYQVLEESGLDYTRKEMEEKVSYSTVTNAAVILIKGTSTDPDEAALIANSYGTVAKKQLMSIVEGSSVKILDKAAVPEEAESRGLVKFGLLGFLLGAVLSALLILIGALNEKSIKSAQDLEYFQVPLLGRIPDHYKAAGKRPAKHKKGSGAVDSFVILNDKTPFAVREAYNSLRTNLVYSFSGKRCKTILVTSTMEHEGKTSTSINLAKSLAESGYKVLLIDGDLRRATVSRSLRIKNNPGLSDYLAGQSAPKDMIQELDEHFSVIAAGTTPPNPNSLLSSEEMKKLAETLKKMFDYIIIDAPPVGPVSDPVILARLCIGYIIVVRNNVPTRDDIRTCMNEMRVSDVPMLGFVFTCDNKASNYSSYKKYGSYDTYY